MLMPKRVGEDLERVEIQSLGDLEDWLEAHQNQSDSVWLVRYKAHIPEKAVAYSDIVDVLLGYGWIDSLPRKLDADRTQLLISPRKPTSNWSAVNKAKVAALLRTGRMKPRGLAVVEAAKAGGQWDALNDVDALKLPGDLMEAFAKSPDARVKFDAFAPSSRRGILEWITTAKTPDTRARRIAETVRLAALGVRANHPEAKGR